MFLKPRRLIWLTVLLLGLGLAASLVSQPEPPVTHQGKEVWQWTEQLHSVGLQQRAEATAALRQLGSNAVPVLLKKLRAEASLPGKIREWLASKLPTRVGRALTHDLHRVSFPNVRSMAAAGLRVLGTNATAAVPALLQNMHGPEAQRIWDAACALGDIGEAAVPGLIPLLEEKDPRVRHATIYALGQIGPPALPAFAALLRRLGDPDPGVRASTLDTLGRLGPGAEPLALKLIEETRGEPRRTAAKVLVAVKPRKQPALLPLLEMARDPDPESRGAALAAMAALHLTHTNAMSVYVSGLADGDARVRLAAAQALGDLAYKTQSVLPTLTLAQQNDPDESVRTAARAACEKIAALATNAGPRP